MREKVSGFAMGVLGIIWGTDRFSKIHIPVVVKRNSGDKQEQDF